MKIKLRPVENDDDGLSDSYVMWWEEGGDIEVEVPDAIVKEWREVEKRRDEIYAYFEENVRSQIRAEQERHRAEWRATHPDEAARMQQMNERWSKTLFDNFVRGLWPLADGVEDLQRKPGDVIKYDEKK